MHVIRYDDYHSRSIEPHKWTEEEMRQEINFFRAEQLTKKMLAEGLITETEYKLIMKECVKVFKPMLAALMPDG